MSIKLATKITGIGNTVLEYRPTDTQATACHEELEKTSYSAGFINPVTGMFREAGHLSAPAAAA